ncbi:S8 family serine peptidase [Bacillus tianshenii]|uniref:S8 family serine peptidase n=1 Tax=Sutcliffiella tianshenii TaxID=1463404 RepID=UPI001CD540F7|nr:S8 family serine peptidase [Bacillus tianshenii]MCA1319185.1 S8 family serine peptidase [Bacillus tianshenii]
MKKSMTYLSTGALLLALVLTAFWPQNVTEATSNADTPRLDENLAKVLQTATGPVEIIITFEHDGGIGQDQIDILKGLGIKKGITFQSLPIAGALATKQQVDMLMTEESVVSVYLNKKLEYENEGSTSYTGVDKVRTDEALRTQNGGMPISGKDVGVVVNDSGVDGTHNDIKLGRNLVQNVFASSNLNSMTGILPITYVENVPNTDSDSGHGTHVAGTVGGTGAMSGGKYEGVAPGAKLIGYGSGAVVAMLDTIGGFDYAMTHQQEYNIRLITNSWGDTSDAGTDFDPYHPINIATKKLFDRGIITVFSAGNSGPGEATISGNYKKAPWVITVAAGTKDGELADFSSRGVKENGGIVDVDGITYMWEDSPTITAPGVDIISTKVLSLLSALSAQKDVEYIDPAHLPYYTTFSGTSMAAPHVAGIIALLLEVNPNLDSFEIKEILQNSATSMPGYEKWEVGSGYVNAYDAVMLARTH